ncbi:SDR family NAD(P)-dependent oxidoreductase [Micromonospora sp. NBC_00389]|uniref:SDR family NAD(P)-dependent oxidoreductase n=1 Tax=Micromonospora sp. NBC_00389 TaxID=2903586 RepID=UPI002E1A3208
MTTVTVITGANKGLGFETARRLIEAGHTVYAGARDAARGAQATKALGARSLLIDITDDASVAAAADQVRAEAGRVRAEAGRVRAEAGRVDVLVNNAGVAGPALPAGELTAADLHRPVEAGGSR